MALRLLLKRIFLIFALPVSVSVLFYLAGAEVYKLCLRHAGQEMSRFVISNADGAATEYFGFAPGTPQARFLADEVTAQVCELKQIPLSVIVYSLPTGGAMVFVSIGRPRQISPMLFVALPEQEPNLIPFME